MRDETAGRVDHPQSRVVIGPRPGELLRGWIPGLQ